MTDALWLLWNRALTDYVKAMIVGLVFRLRREETKTCLLPVSQLEPADPALSKPE